MLDFEACGLVGTAVTDQAILLAILGRQPQRVPDRGCGEGWLLRAAGERGIEAAGVDAEPALLDAARAAGSAQSTGLRATPLRALAMAARRTATLAAP
nr:hypothetical protein [Pseudomonas sp. UBA4617]